VRASGTPPSASRWTRCSSAPAAVSQLATYGRRPSGSKKRPDQVGGAVAGAVAEHPAEQRVRRVVAVEDVPPETAPDGSRAALAAIRERIGFVPNLAAAIASSPTALECFGALQGNLRGNTIPRLEREVAGLAVSYENDCAYPMAAHSTFANAAGESP
jgi:AhpD family alkylhydroperoxidase